MKIRFLGHASFILEDGVKIAIDPFKIKKKEPVDYIFITHDHYDHCSPDDIAKLADPDSTIIITPPDSAARVKQYAKQVFEIEPGQAYETGGIKFRTIPAYNQDKPFHPRENNWVGYIIYLAQSIYHCGDTDLIPEMKGLKPDIFLVPVGGTYTMDSEQAVTAVKIVAPQKVIPMHYGSIVGSTEDAKKLKNQVSIPVEILEAE